MTTPTPTPTPTLREAVNYRTETPVPMTDEQSEMIEAFASGITSQAMRYREANPLALLVLSQDQEGTITYRMAGSSMALGITLEGRPVRAARVSALASDLSLPEMCEMVARDFRDASGQIEWAQVSPQALAKLQAAQSAAREALESVITHMESLA